MRPGHSGRGEAARASVALLTLTLAFLHPSGASAQPPEIPEVEAPAPDGPLPDQPLKALGPHPAAWWTNSFLGTSCLLTLGVLALRRRRPAAVEPVLDPFRRLEEDLHRLPPGGDARSFHHGLSQALRRYLAARLAAALLELTTREAALALEREKVPDKTRGELVDLLQTCDEARFAQRSVAAHQRQKRRTRARRGARAVEGWWQRRHAALNLEGGSTGGQRLPRSSP